VLPLPPPVCLEELAVWCQRRLEDGQGEDPCTIPGKSNEQTKKAAHRAALKEVWKELPDSVRAKIGQLMAQMIARKILPPGSEEGSNEYWESPLSPLGR
jgi:hypothetical protein